MNSVGGVRTHSSRFPHSLRIEMTSISAIVMSTFRCVRPEHGSFKKSYSMTLDLLSRITERRTKRMAEVRSIVWVLELPKAVRTRDSKVSQDFDMSFGRLSQDG